MHIGVISEPAKFPEIQDLLDLRAWKLHFIQTRAEAWLEMKEKDYGLFVFHAEHWEDKYFQFLLVLQNSFAEAYIAFLCDDIEDKWVKKIISELKIPVFSLKKDKDSLRTGIEKLLAGEEVYYRKDKRFRALPFVEVRADGMQPISCRTENLSLSGAEIRGNLFPLKKDEKITLVFKDSERSERLVPAIIRWLKYNDSGSETKAVGVEFLTKNSQ